GHGNPLIPGLCDTLSRAAPARRRHSSHEFRPSSSPAPLPGPLDACPLHLIVAPPMPPVAWPLRESSIARRSPHRSACPLFCTSSVVVRAIALPLRTALPPTAPAPSSPRNPSVQINAGLLKSRHRLSIAEPLCIPPNKMVERNVNIVTL
ncbi:hypothetical protein U1Q18_016344, partial [Sarracenia purpurea var. burkii]